MKNSIPFWFKKKKEKEEKERDRDKLKKLISDKTPNRL